MGVAATLPELSEWTLPWGFQYCGGYHDACGGYHDACGGYHEYCGGCSIPWGTQMTEGFPPQ